MTILCSVASCGKPAKKRGWCGTHYQHWRRHGDPLWTAGPTDHLDRIFSRLTPTPAVCGICGRPWRDTPFCPSCLALIKADSEAGEVECWIRIPGHPGYIVSSFGRVKSLDRIVVEGGRRVRRNGQMLKAPASGAGYPAVSLKDQTVSVHTVVARAFLGDPPPGEEVLHLGDVKTDNRLWRLRYDTDRANVLDMVANGNHPQANKAHCPAGHEYNEQNTIIRIGRNGRRWRRCRICSRECDRRRREKKRAAAGAR